MRTEEKKPLRQPPKPLIERVSADQMSALGIHARIAAAPAPFDAVSHRLERFELQSAARLVLSDKHRTRSCLRLKQRRSEGVGVKYSQSASFSNLQTCGSVWTCAVCASKISEHRRSELEEGLANWKAKGGSVYLMTLTFSHSRNDDLASLVRSFADAQRIMKSCRAWQAVKEGFKIEGTIRALEVTHGNANGWHPHAHILVFTSAPIDAQKLRQAVFPQWLKSCRKAGLSDPNLEHGVDVKDGSYAAKYVSKWGLSHEVTKAHLKKGKAESKSPFDLLRSFVSSDDPKKSRRCGALFAEYAKAFFGQRQLWWSHGLRELLEIDVEEKTDEKIAEGADVDAVLLAILTDDDWRLVVSSNSRGQLLEAVNRSQGSPESVSAFVSSLRQLYPMADVNIDPKASFAQSCPRPERRPGYETEVVSQSDLLVLDELRQKFGLDSALHMSLAFPGILARPLSVASYATIRE